MVECCGAVVAIEFVRCMCGRGVCLRREGRRGGTRERARREREMRVRVKIKIKKSVLHLPFVVSSI